MTYAYKRLSRDVDGIPAGTVVAIQLDDTATTFTGPVTSALHWSPPPTIDPIVWTPTAQDNVGVFPPDRDVRIEATNVITWADGITIRGGRNVAWIGGEVRFDEQFFDDTSANPAARRNRGVYIQGNSDGSTTDRHFFMQGVKFGGTHLYEGINFDALGDTRVTATFQDLWFGRINWREPPWDPGLGKHDGGDALQPWRGPWRLRVDKFVASESPYQAIFLQPRQYQYTLDGHGSDPFDVYEFRNVHLRGVTGSSSQLMAMTGGEPGPDSRVCYNVYVEPGNRLFRQAVKGVWNGLQEGPPPVPFVSSNTPGVGYVSPGYV